jgi:hypothetical protein
MGIGNVGFALANSLSKSGYKVFIAARDPHSKNVQNAVTKNHSLLVVSIPEAVDQADVIFLATPFEAVEPALKSAGDLTGKIIVDCTNPVGPGLAHGLNNKISGGEFVQRLAPAARVVKAFTIYGFENFENPNYPGYGDLKPAMLIAGNDAEAKRTVSQLCEELGWQPVDVGNISMSLHLEHMTLLWIKMGRVGGRGAGFVWAMLTR